MIRAPGSLGFADLIALKAGEKPRMIEVKGTAAGPYAGFLPAHRKALSEVARLAGAVAELAYWPARKELRWIQEQALNERSFSRRPPSGLKPKDLVGIPWMVAFALRADGWYLRSDVIWAKPNPMPESITDRPTKAHEYLFLLTKGPRYDADAIREDAIHAGETVTLGPKSLSKGQATGMAREPSGNGKADSVVVAAGRNKRSVWTVTTQPFPGAHFATFPPKLIEPCILAGSAPFVLECPECKVECKDDETRHLRTLRSTVHDSEAGELHASVLQPDLREPSHGSDQGDEYGQLPQREGVQAGLLTGASDGAGERLRFGASLGDGREDRATVDGGRSCPSPERRPSGQRPRKSAVDAEAEARQAAEASGQADHLSALSGQDCGERSCPACGSALTERRSVVLDPFSGAGTTGLVALRHDRDYIGIELNPEYAAMSRERIREDAPLLNLEAT